MKWNKVSEVPMPKDGRDFLAAYKGRVVFMQYDEGYCMVYSPGDGDSMGISSVKLNKIKYWADLPELPKEPEISCYFCGEYIDNPERPLTILNIESYEYYNSIMEKTFFCDTGCVRNWINRDLRELDEATEDALRILEEKKLRMEKEEL